MAPFGMRKAITVSFLTPFEMTPSMTDRLLRGASQSSVTTVILQ